MHTSSEEWASQFIGARLPEKSDYASRERYLLAAIGECSEDAIISESLAGDIDGWNPAAERLYGYTVEEIRGKNHSALTPDEQLPELHQILDQVANGLTVERREIPQLKKDGTVVEALLSAGPIRDSQGRILGVLTIARDISERKAVEQLKASLRGKEVLLKEVHHRVKNDLQVISSLLNLQARHVLDRRALEMFKESQNRVRSIALFHEKLYQSKDLAHVEASEYLKTLLANLLAAYGARSSALALDVGPEEVLLGVDVAVPLGLVVNELISNALKHAFPSGHLGEIRVELRRVGETQCRLSVIDNGAGFPSDLDFRRAPSLGLNLVCTLVDQLGGAIELIQTGGTTFIVTFEVE